MDIKRAGSQPSGKGPADWFTGMVRIDPLFPVTAPARGGRQCGHVRAGRAHGLAYAPARPGPHRHGRLRPGAARGRPDRGNSPRRRRGLRAGRETLARRRPTTAMTHIAIQEALDGKAVEWMEKVSDEQYQG